MAKILGWTLALLGGFFTVAGGYLALIGGSPYYVVTGLAMILSGAWIGRGDPRGRWLYVVIWLATIVWALWEVGPDPLQLVPRVVAPTVLLILVILPWLIAGMHMPRVRTRAVPAMLGIVALLIAVPVLRSRPAEAQDPALPAGLPVAARAPVGDWTDYGGTLSGQRYSALSQITPGNVGKLELAWTQRTGDLPDRAEAVEHKREYHSEATPIHIGDTLYTCTPHSIVQAIDATTGRTKWTWRDQVSRQGNSYLVCRGVAFTRPRRARPARAASSRRPSMHA
ncbi:hypothetical protein P0F65_16315 [Sphingomonas sp. I4]